MARKNFFDNGGEYPVKKRSLGQKLEKEKRKIFVLDTNILISDPEAVKNSEIMM